MWSFFLLLPRSEPYTLESHLLIIRAVLVATEGDGRCQSVFWMPVPLMRLLLILAILGAAKADLVKHSSLGSSAGVFKNMHSRVWQSDTQ